MKKKPVHVLMLLLGVALILVSVVLFTNTYFCLFNKASCGMVEPFYAIPAGLLGVAMAALGAFGMFKGRRL